VASKDQESPKLPDQERGAVESGLVESGQSREVGLLEARLHDLPPTGSPLRLPALIEIVKEDMKKQWQRGQHVGLETYLEAVPELGTLQAFPPELILAEYELRCSSDAQSEMVLLKKRFPSQAEALGKLAEPEGGDAGPDAVLTHIDESANKSHGTPLSMVQAARIPVKMPKRFGRYQIIKRLGRGAMGTVYLARDTQLDRRVALKVPHFRSEDDTQTPNRGDLERFTREARVAATLDHPNLCPVYDVGQIDGIHYLTMAFVRGRPLSDYIDPERLMPPRRVATAVRKLALALEEAHARSIIHRDLKPSNIMVNRLRELVIMDFGLAWRIGSHDERLTKTGLVLGTPAYMSPEQISGKEESLGPRCDIYSLGVIMYEMLTACRPFDGPEAVVLGQILYVEPVPPSGHRPDLDPRIEAICLKAMSKKPEDRYATMGELAADLGDYLRSEASVPEPSPEVDSPDSPALNDTQVSEAGQRVLVSSTAQVTHPSEDGAATIVSTEQPGTAIDRNTLEGKWREWTSIIELFALRRRRFHLDWHEYDKLHKDLIEACRTRAETAAETQQVYYRKLEDLVLPWLTPKVLAQTEREILFSLLLNCRQVDRELSGSQAEQEQARRKARANMTRDVVIFIAAILTVVGLMWVFFSS